MTSDRKRASNLSNSRLSTGPRSRSGKAASSRNALRHGLAVPLALEPQGERQVTSLVSQLIEPEETPQVRYQAGVFAEATLEIRRIAMLKAFIIKTAKEETRDFLYASVDGEDIDYLEPFRSTIYELERVDRYERRAISRRNRAIKELLRSEAA